MELSLEEISVYLRNGGAVPEGEFAVRVMELAGDAPIVPRGIWVREGDEAVLCGTIGHQFDRWHRALSVLSAADALIAQAIGAAAVEKVMDGLEKEICESLLEGESLSPRRSPGYEGVPMSVNGALLAKLDAAKKIGVSLTESMLLVPSKSVVAVCAILPKGR